MFSGKHVSVEMLGPEWWHRMIDVCGVGTFRREKERSIYVTHLDLDHLPLKEHILEANVRFFTAPKFMKELSAFYGDAFSVHEYDDVLMLKHSTVRGGRVIQRLTCAFFIGEAMIIPECDSPDKLIEEYRPKFALMFVAQQSRQHSAGFSDHRRDVFILHNKVWKPYAPNVIPKIVFSSTDKNLFRNSIARLMYENSI
jgi:hypothetical protein